MQERAPQRDAVTVTFTLNGRAGHASRRRRSHRWPTRCATSSASPAPRSAARRAIAAPAPCSLDGEQVCACLVATAQADGASDRTVEGAGPHGLTDRLRRAFLAHGAAQCGICTPGMLMAAADLLARDPAPSRARRSRTPSAACCAAAPAISRSSRRSSMWPAGSDPRASGSGPSTLRRGV